MNRYEIGSVFPDVLGTRIAGLEASATQRPQQANDHAARSLAETSVHLQSSSNARRSAGEYPGRPSQTLALRVSPAVDYKCSSTETSAGQLQYLMVQEGARSGGGA